MSPEQLLVQYGVAGAVLVSIVLFLKALHDERVDRTKERIAAQEERNRFIDLMEKYRMTVDLIVERCTGKRNKI